MTIAPRAVAGDADQSAANAELAALEKKMLHTDRMAALGQLVSSIAHELNNPLTSILGYAQLLRRRKGDAGLDREAQYIFEQAERASRIAKNLLLFAREAKPERVPVSLNEVAERTLALRSYELRLVNINVECRPGAWPCR